MECAVQSRIKKIRDGCCVTGMGTVGGVSLCLGKQIILVIFPAKPDSIMADTLNTVRVKLSVMRGLHDFFIKLVKFL